MLFQKCGALDRKLLSLTLKGLTEHMMCETLTIKTKEKTITFAYML
jgi:hypothetical protein